MEAYYQSASWRRKRQQRLNHDRHICQGCGITAAQLADLGWPPLQVHHKNDGPPDYKYPSFGSEQLTDLLTLCSICHDGITNSVRQQRFKLDPRKQVAAVHIAPPSLFVPTVSERNHVQPPNNSTAPARRESIAVPQRADRRSAKYLRQGDESGIR